MASRNFKAVFWPFIFAPATILSQLTLTIILSRLLTPTDYGLFATANSVLVVGTSLCQRGIAASIQRERDLTPTHFGDSIIVSLALAVLAGTCVFLLAPILGTRNGPEKLQVLSTEIIRTSIIPLTIFLITAPAVGVIQRNLRLLRMSLYNWLALTIGNGAIAVTFALLGFGAWSLSLGGISNALILGTLAVFSAGMRPEFHPGLRRAWTTLSKALTFSGLRTIDMLWSQSPVLLVSISMPAADTGIFQRLHYLSLFSYQTTVWIIVSSMFPIISQMMPDKARLSHHYLRMTRIYIVLVAFLTVFIWFAAPDILLVLFGRRWATDPDLFRLTLLGCMLFALSQVPAVFLESRGKFSFRYMASLFSLIGFVAGSLIIRPNSLYEIAAIFLFSSAILLSLSMAFMAIWLELTLISIGKAFAPGVAVTLITSLILWATRREISQFLPDGMLFGCIIAAVAAICFVGSVRVAVDKPARQDLLSLFSRFRRLAPILKFCLG